ncbi:MAG: TIGR03915 family putative DNA repair protein [Clostridia bacterium]|nr:TIGR03915 family putative DNA repair protein [Clostridia bacterium]
MFIYIYDGSFEGLLTSIYESFYRKQVPYRIICRHDPQVNFIDQNVHIETDIEKAKKVYDSIRQKISSVSLKKVFYTYLSDYEDSGIWIYDYLKLGWKMGSKVDNHLADERVLKVHKTSLKVLAESHRLLGLIRFQEVYEDVFYSPIEPDHNILRLIAPHFEKRFADQNWIIHDIKRSLTAVYDKNTCEIKSTEFKGSFQKSEDEASYQAMWKKYFESIAIKNRINPKLQRRCMPARYWKHLIEMQPD